MVFKSHEEKERENFGESLKSLLGRGVLMKIKLRNTEPSDKWVKLLKVHFSDIYLFLFWSSSFANRIRCVGPTALMLKSCVISHSCDIVGVP